ncbi:MAG TPA: hypothetical protein VGN72_07445 [Tepidisphaeraceae bacterium]|nr:hypothetical protein [Tepidisphaeraceae bacterium]
MAFASLAIGLAGAARGAFVVNDFDGTANLTFSAAGGSIVTVADSADASDDLELRIESAFSTSGTFTQFAKSSGLGRTGATIEALLNGTSIDLTLSRFDADTAVPQAFNFRLVANSNANNFGYVGLAAVAVPATAGTVNFSYDYSANTAFKGALDAYAAGGGTFFEFFFDNSGFPGITKAQTFYVDDVTVQAAVPEPTGAAISAVAVALAALGRRRRRSLL